MHKLKFALQTKLSTDQIVCRIGEKNRWGYTWSREHISKIYKELKEGKGKKEKEIKYG